MSASGKWARVETRSRPRLPRPMIADFTRGPCNFSASTALAVGRSITSSTPPNIVMSAAVELPLRKSRRFTSCQFGFCCFIKIRYLPQFLDSNIPKRHRPVVALQENGPWFCHLVVDFRSGRFVALDILVDFHAVHRDANLIANDGRLGRLPFSSRFRDKLVGCLEIV